MTYNQLGFAFTGLQTLSFATIDSAYKADVNTHLISRIGFGVDIDKHTISCTTKFSFEIKKDRPFLIIEVQGHFTIEETDFKEKVSQKNNSFLITRDLATHFAVLTIGATRGVLHSKTEQTIYNQFLLPTLDVKNIIQENIVLNPADKTTN